jgi:hypothetical protein
LATELRRRNAKETDPSLRECLLPRKYSQGDEAMQERAWTLYLDKQWNRYNELTSRKEKSNLLNETAKVTSLSRDHLIRVFNNDRSPSKIRKAQNLKGRPKYTDKEKELLALLWRRMGIWGADKFKAAIPDWIGFWDCDAANIAERRRILEMSEATIERVLAPVKRQLRRAANSGTVPAHMRHEIELSIDHLAVSEPGHVQVDTVAHCGGSMSGQFLWTVTCTDMWSGWVYCFAVWHKNVPDIVAGLQQVEGIAPFRVKTWRFDNGTEFLNKPMVEEFETRREESQRIKILRSRPYKKNDQCYVEQKNGDVVRGHLGYGRFDDPAITTTLNLLYKSSLNPLLNHFIPQAKQEARVRVGGRIHRKHGKPRTPVSRLLDWDKLTPGDRLRISEEANDFDPFTKRNKVREIISKITKISCRENTHSERKAS